MGEVLDENDLSDDEIMEMWGEEDLIFAELESDPDDEDDELVRQVREELQRQTDKQQFKRTTLAAAHRAYSALSRNDISMPTFRNWVEGDWPRRNSFEFAVSAVVELLRQNRQSFRARHGLKCAIETGCRCPSCAKCFEEYLVIRQRVMVDGETLEAVGTDLGVTRQRVNQVIKLAHPGYSLNSAKKERKRKKREEERKKHKHYCMICNEVFYRKSGKRTCGSEKGCSEIFQLLARDINEDRRETARVNVSKNYIKNHTREEDPVKYDHYMSMIAREGKSSKVNSQGFWFQEGSKTFEAACELYRRGGRAFKMLREVKQEQVRRYVEAQGGNEE